MLDCTYSSVGIYEKLQTRKAYSKTVKWNKTAQYIDINKSQGIQNDWPQNSIYDKCIEIKPISIGTTSRLYNPTPTKFTKQLGIVRMKFILVTSGKSRSINSKQ